MYRVALQTVHDLPESAQDTKVAEITPSKLAFSVSLRDTTVDMLMTSYQGKHTAHLQLIHSSSEIF